MTTSRSQHIRRNGNANCLAVPNVCRVDRWVQVDERATMGHPSFAHACEVPDVFGRDHRLDDNFPGASSFHSSEVRCYRRSVLELLTRRREGHVMPADAALRREGLPLCAVSRSSASIPSCCIMDAQIRRPHAGCVTLFPHRFAQPLQSRWVDRHSAALKGPPQQQRWPMLMRPPMSCVTWSDSAMLARTANCRQHDQCVNATTAQTPAHHTGSVTSANTAASTAVNHSSS